MKFTRRRFLVSSLGATCATLLPHRYTFARTSDNVLEITAGRSDQKLYGDDAPASSLWTYNGMAPGPEIRIRKGERVRVKLINNLEEPTSIHWHGIRIENAMDGVAGLTQEPVEPGQSFTYDFVAPDAGTYWYHAHNRSWNQVARGLYGPLVIEEDSPAFDREHDLTLVLDDWRLNDDGVLDTESLGSLMEWGHAGRLGNWLTVNSRTLPEFTLQAGEPYRLRLINACNARILEIDPGRFNGRILSYDGQDLSAPQTLDYAPLLIGPAQRVDLLVIPQTGEDFEIEEVSGNQNHAFMKFQIAGDQTAIEAPIKLQPNVLPVPDLANAKAITLDMTGGAMRGVAGIVYQGRELTREEVMETGQLWGMNGVANLPDAPLFQAKRGETITLETKNDTAFAHAMHIHGHHFRILERSGSDVDEGQPWRDTFLIGPDQTTKIAFVADNPGKWLLHCHMLEHAAAGMNTWFEVA
ncbi:MAG: multicopper oxidase family protein [Rhizobiales bacterium]|nr:multicopper oxidase family protein [Hyphomicrobiales bacterium]